MRSQRLVILEYARNELTSVLGRGDRLVVSELSRLGRSLGQAPCAASTAAARPAWPAAAVVRRPRRGRLGNVGIRAALKQDRHDLAPVG